MRASLRGMLVLVAGAFVLSVPAQTSAGNGHGNGHGNHGNHGNGWGNGNGNGWGWGNGGGWGGWGGWGNGNGWGWGNGNGWGWGNGNGPWWAPDCWDIEGDFSSAPVIEGCDSPIGFCTLGALEGDLDGSYAFTMFTSTPEPTAEHPTREVFTGESVIETDCGTLYGDDTGEIWFDGEAGFVTRVTVWTGDGCFEDVTGEIVASGLLDLATGATDGTYTGELCESGGC